MRNEAPGTIPDYSWLRMQVSHYSQGNLDCEFELLSMMGLMGDDD
jgi:hypothetical protein